MSIERTYPGNDDVVKFVERNISKEELGKDEGVTRTPIQYMCNCTGQSALMNALDVPQNKSIVCVLYYEGVIQKSPSLQQAFENDRAEKEKALIEEIENELSPKSSASVSPVETELKTTPVLTPSETLVREITENPDPDPNVTIENIEVVGPGLSGNIKITKTTRRRINLDPQVLARGRETQDDSATLTHLSSFQRQMKQRAEQTILGKY